MREFPMTRELWIERDDFREDPPKKYFRLFPGNTVRLKYGYIVRCTGFDKDENGQVTTVYADYLDRKSVVSGKSVSVRVDLGGRRIITKINKLDNQHRNPISHIKKYT